MFVWIDLEMTGLNPEINRICEIATIITDRELNIVGEGPNLVIHLEDKHLDIMDEWCTKHHGESGLTDRIRESTVTVEKAEQETLKFISDYVGEKEAPLCGNSIWQDRRFLAKEMPLLESYLHYRCVDVTSIKILSDAWYKKKIVPPQKAMTHRALDDIRESIYELQFYREHVFKER